MGRTQPLRPDANEGRRRHGAGWAGRGTQHQQDGNGCKKKPTGTLTMTGGPTSNGQAEVRLMNSPLIQRIGRWWIEMVNLSNLSPGTGATGALVQ